ncbi:bifunctional riboflavin kinase/FAD synthetase [Demequina activiva]|uniref:Riboflavin biosynthesis protein n=1 Tax=Demequina activiva TaxID=1582364 RepID=A0A919UG94_9MICO|nr:bifunctional riboflavin kinase/FAD synthetase [Demequina activiva]GIG54219.1 riboflavin biosynthesis protein [Demequina activiva]
MHVWNSLEEVPADLGPTTVTLGNFDGVHRGHQAVLTRMVEDAEARGHRAVAMTFEPHPKAVHDPEHPPLLIMGLDDKLTFLEETGLDGIIVVPYTLDFAQQTPQQFVRTWLVDGLGAARVVVGRDTKFGRGNAGDVDTLRALGQTMGFDVEVIDDACAISESGRRWSSTWVRELLEDGKLDEAAEVLGRPHRLRGVVVDGDKLGRTIGFPTANLDVRAGMIPRHGVYAGWLTVLDARGNDKADLVAGVALPTAVSLGFNYTVGSEGLRVEGFVIDRDDLNLYGAEVAFDLVRWRRPMLDFGSLEALTDALGSDVEWCRDVLQLD